MFVSARSSSRQRHEDPVSGTATAPVEGAPVGRCRSDVKENAHKKLGEVLREARGEIAVQRASAVGAPPLQTAGPVTRRTRQAMQPQLRMPSASTHVSAAARKIRQQRAFLPCGLTVLPRHVQQPSTAGEGHQ
jgi:hypothetical protein